MHIKTATKNLLKAATVPASSNTLSPFCYKTLRQLKLIVAFQITVCAIHERVSLFSNTIENNIDVYKKQRYVQSGGNSYQLQIDQKRYNKLLFDHYLLPLLLINLQ